MINAVMKQEAESAAWWQVEGEALSPLRSKGSRFLSSISGLRVRDRTGKVIGRATDILLDFRQNPLYLLVASDAGGQSSRHLLYYYQNISYINDNAIFLDDAAITTLEADDESYLSLRKCSEKRSYAAEWRCKKVCQQSRHLWNLT